jgi:hypothetical protein
LGCQCGETGQRPAWEVGERRPGEARAGLRKGGQVGGGVWGRVGKSERAGVIGDRKSPGRDWRGASRKVVRRGLAGEDKESRRGRGGVDLGTARVVTRAGMTGVASGSGRQMSWEDRLGLGSSNRIGWVRNGLSERAGSTRFGRGRFVMRRAYPAQRSRLSGPDANPRCTDTTHREKPRSN